MKCFIVSLGIIIMGVSGLIYGWDLHEYTTLQFHLKVLTESCAACGALSFEDSVYLTSKEITYNSVDVQNTMNYFIDHASSDLYCFKNGVLKIENYETDSENDCVTVTLNYTSDHDLFRLPFISKRELYHSSCYQWKSYEEQL